MQHRNVLSRLFPQSLRRTGAAALVAAFFAAPAQAQFFESFPALALLSPQEAAPAVAPHEALAVHEVLAAPAITDTIDLTAETSDLWVRIRNGFSMPNLNDDVVLMHQQWYQNRPDMLRRMVERSRRYLHHIVEELEKRGMPTELALLPMVESSFNPMAYSRAHASGLWQFIPATGKRYNLTQDWWQDQRRDILASTSAALDYLQAIYEMNSDWHLALASYNWGENAVKRAVEKNLAKGLPTDFSSLTMPNETRHYVPKLQALKNIFGNPRLMAELKLPELLNRPYFATVETKQPMDLKTAAKLAEMPITEFVALNPGHNRPVIKADTPVVIPAEKLETFQSNLENHEAPLTQWQAYTLKAGDRLEKVAPRFGISLSDLKHVNGLNGKIKVSTGALLLVPSGKGGAALDEAGAAPKLPQIALPEPAPRSKKFAKAGKGKAVVLARPAKGGKLAAKATGRATGKAVAKAAPAKSLAAKPAARGAKVAAVHGRRT